MPRAGNQKLKLIYLLDMLMTQSDENHPLNTAALIEGLNRQGISAERKSIYADIECLVSYGYDIEHTGGKNGGYYMASRRFELPELKLLVDAVQSSKFITAKKSEQLIRKLEGLANKYDAGELNRQVYVSNRVKNMNESIYYNIDKLHRAMNENRQIIFSYFEWTRDKEKKLRRNGKKYCVSPWSLCWDDENYYLVSYDNEEGIIKHFRVDKMLDIELDDAERVGKDIFSEFDSAIYSRQVFGMFGGTPELVTLKCKNRLAGVIIDRFGTQINMRVCDEDYFEVTVKVCVSPPFLSWVFMFGGDMEILSPESAKKSFCEQISAAKVLYKM